MTNLPYVMGDEPCPQCQHPFDPHILVAMGAPQDGGFILCPVEGCNCIGTWDVKGDTELSKLLGLFRTRGQGEEP